MRELLTIKPTPTKKQIVSCEGEPKGRGHPKVYLKILPSGQVTCPYCAKVFEKVG